MLKALTHLLSVLTLTLLGLFAVTLPRIHAQGDVIAYGDVINGEFTNSGVHSWTFDGQAQDSIMITLTGNNVAVGLTLQQPDGETVEGIVGDTTFFAILETTLPEDGEYRIFASTTAENASGEYSLSLIGTSADPSAGTIFAHLLTINGSRDGTDADYSFVGVGGDTIVISMTSPDFDTFLELRDPEGIVIIADDDGGIALNSLIILTLPVDGTYVVVARAYDDASVGPYAISVTSFAPATIENGNAIAVTSDGQPTIFSLVADPEQSVSLAVTTLDFDPIVSIRSTDGTTIATNDDMEDNVNSLLETILSEAGTYFVVVDSYDAYTSGAYIIGYNADEETMVAATIGTDIPVTVTGDILPIAYGDQIDSQLDGAEQRYSFDGSTNDAVTIEMTSNNLDAFVQLLDENGELVGQDDDSGQAFNAHLEITLPADGAYIIVASVRIGNPIGTFSLRLTSDE